MKSIKDQIKMKRLMIFLLAAGMFACTTNEKKKYYSGKDISTMVSIERDKKTKEAKIKIDLTENWELYLSTNPESLVREENPVLRGNQEGIYSISLPDKDRRYYFLLKTEKSTITLTERHLPMEGGYNFRDMGGIKTQEGRFVKWGKMFRSDELAYLTDKDLEYLSSTGLRTIVDFRSEEEITKAPDRNPASMSQNIRLSINPANILDLASLKNISSAGVMNKIYQALVTDTAVVEQYYKFFSLLQEEQKDPLMFHCSAGKDRTGLAAALFLYSLGVDEKVIMEDYLSSNHYLGDKYAPYIQEKPELKQVFEVQREYLLTSFSLIKTEYGSIDNYLTKRLGVDLAKMKKIYLYPDF